MNDETEKTVEAEIEKTVVVADDATRRDTTTIAEGEPAGTQADPVTKPADWRDKRIAKLTAQLSEVKRKAAATPIPATANGAPDPVALQAEIDKLANAKAQELAPQIAEVERFNSACEAAASLGKKEFADFDSRLAKVVEVADLSDPANARAYNTFLLAALETGEAHRVIHALGADQNEAARVLGLSPVKMAMEVAKLAIAKPAKETSAPKPIKTVQAKNGSAIDIDPTDPERASLLSMEEWMKRRGEQLKTKRRA